MPVAPEFDAGGEGFEVWETFKEGAVRFLTFRSWLESMVTAQWVAQDDPLVRRLLPEVAELLAEIDRWPRRPGLRLAAWRAVWGALPHNPVLHAKFTHLTRRDTDRLVPAQARAACAATLLRWLHAIITRRQPFHPDIATGLRRAAGQPIQAAA